MVAMASQRVCKLVVSGLVLDYHLESIAVFVETLLGALKHPPLSRFHVFFLFLFARGTWEPWKVC